jgi:DNA-binding transcriptional ArsR family regulator
VTCTKAARLILKPVLNGSKQLDRAFQALSDPVRRGMLSRLSRGPASVSQLAQPFQISLPAILQHLKALQDCGLVRSEKKGRVRTVQLEPKALSAAESWIAERRTEWEAQLDRFENYVQTLKCGGEE